MLYEFLVSKKIKAIHTREVGGTIEAEKIRNLLVYSELLPMSELLLVMAARYEHLSKVIVPALADGCFAIGLYVIGLWLWRSNHNSLLSIR